MIVIAAGDYLSRSSVCRCGMSSCQRIHYGSFFAHENRGLVRCRRKATSVWSRQRFERGLRDKIANELLANFGSLGRGVEERD
jgi:hypothetical protein